MQEITLTDNDRDQWQKDMQLRCNGDSPYGDVEGFLATAKAVATDNLVVKHPSLFVGFRNGEPGYEAILIHNTPTDSSLPDTPARAGRCTDKTTFVSEAVVAGTGEALGSIFSFAQEKAGELIHNVCPVSGREKSKSNEGSDAELLFHTEVAFHPERPEMLALYCVRDDRDGRALTPLSSAREALAQLDQRTVEVLQQPRFVTAPPQSFSVPTAAPLRSQADRQPQPIVYNWGGGQSASAEFRVVCSFDSTSAVDPEAVEALSSFQRALERNARGVKLVPGDLLIINNRTMFHSRTSFSPYYDGRDRWLQRVYVRQHQENRTLHKRTL